MLHTDIDRNSGKICLSFKRKKDAKGKELSETKKFYSIFFFSFPSFFSLVAKLDGSSIMESNKNRLEINLKCIQKIRGGIRVHIIHPPQKERLKEMRSSAAIKASRAREFVSKMVLQPTHRFHGAPLKSKPTRKQIIKSVCGRLSALS